jgi:hypothetical protein
MPILVIYGQRVDASSFSVADVAIDALSLKDGVAKMRLARMSEAKSGMDCAKWTGRPGFRADALIRATPS